MRRIHYISACCCILVGGSGGLIFGKQFAARHAARGQVAEQTVETQEQAWKRLGFGVFKKDNINTIVWYADPGASYCIEKSTDLQRWHVVEDAYPEESHTGGRLSYQDAASPGEKSYYRVNIL